MISIHRTSGSNIMLMSFSAGKNGRRHPAEAPRQPDRYWFVCFINGHFENLSEPHFNHSNNLRAISECCALQILTQSRSVTKNSMGGEIKFRNQKRPRADTGCSATRVILRDGPTNRCAHNLRLIIALIGSLTDAKS